jgi:hypothetical protein
MPNRQQIAHLGAHLPYELLMLRYTHGKLPEQQYQLDFNSRLECFAVHARLLINFLSNHEKGDSNFEARDFTPSYKCPKRDHLYGALERLRRQIMHLGKARPTNPRGKFNRRDADKIYQWIEPALAQFIESLAPRYRSHWNEDRANLEIFRRVLTVAGPAPR